MSRAIFFEFTFVCSIWLVIAVIGDRLDAVRRHISAQRIIARRLQCSSAVTTINATANPHTNISTRIANPLGFEWKKWA